MLSYVYSLSIEGVVRYIGKGTGNRVADHVKKAANINRRRDVNEKVRASYFYNKLAQALRAGHHVTTAIIADGLTEGQAYVLEKQIIADAPQGQLYNTAEGGRGLTSAIARRTWDDPSYRARQAMIQETLRKQFIVDLWSDEAFRDSHAKRSSENLSRLMNDPEFRAKQSAGTTKKWQDPEFRARKTQHNREIAIANNARPEKKRQQSDLISKQNADPTFKERRIAALKAALADPEISERRSNAIRVANSVRKLRRVHAEMQSAYARGI